MDIAQEALSRLQLAPLHWFRKELARLSNSLTSEHLLILGENAEVFIRSQGAVFGGRR